MRSRRKSESGFALLLVFALSAIVAVMLYRELPRTAFEGQRAKEELLIERGEQYQRAIKLYVRKFGRYPETLEKLEKDNTTNQRFLRRRYKDPMTGKDEWRLIHAGPGGFFTDSLTQKPPQVQEGDKQDTTAAAAPPPPGEEVIPTYMRRRASEAVQYAGSGAGPSSSEEQQSYNEQPAYTPPPGSEMGPPAGQEQANAGEPQPGQQPGPGPVPIPGQPGEPTDVNPAEPSAEAGDSGEPTQPAQPGGIAVSGGMAGGQPGFVPQPGMQPGGVQPGFQGQPGVVPPGFQPQPGVQPQQPGFPPQPGSVQGYPGGQPGAYPPGMNQPAINPASPFRPGPPLQPSPPGATQQPTAAPSVSDVINQRLRGANPYVPGFGTAGGQFGGGIAGVASTAEMEGIKTYNKHKKYNEWEFLYDPKKDTGMGAPGVPATAGPQPGFQPFPTNRDSVK